MKSQKHNGITDWYLLSRATSARVAKLFLAISAVHVSISTALVDTTFAQSSGPAQPNFQESAGSAQDQPAKLIVKLSDGATIDDAQVINVSYPVRRVTQLFGNVIAPEMVLVELQQQLVDASLEGQQALTRRLLAQQRLVTRLHERAKRVPQGTVVPDLAPFVVVELDSHADVQAAADAYATNPVVEYARPVQMVRLSLVPDDPYYHSYGAWGQGYDDLWGLKRIDCENAWDITLGDGILVSVVDTGLYRTHIDIRSNVWSNAGEIPGNGVDDDHNRYIDDVWGYDFANMDPDPQDDHGHGTHVSGTIAAVGNNGIGVIGVAPSAHIMGIKGFDDQGYGDDASLAVCIVYAVNNGADVINCSWGGAGSSPAIERAVAYALAKGCVVVAAAGNSSMDVSGFFPANIPGVIAVAASDPNDHTASFSNYGYGLDVSAPGGADANILSLLSIVHTSAFDPLIVDGAYLRLAGTSMAAPHVSGLVGLILANHLGFSHEEVRQVVRTSADDVDEPGIDAQSGCGRINAARALTIGSALMAEITSPSGLVQGTVTISGTAAGLGFVQYELFYKDFIASTWTMIGQTSNVEVTNGVLGSWNVEELDFGNYVLKLVATDTSGFLFQDANHVHRGPEPVWPTSLVAANVERPVWANGAYQFNGVMNGKPSYLLGELNENEHMLVSWTGSYWNMHDDNEQRYTNSTATDWPPAHGWVKMPEGTPSELTVSPGTVVASDGEFPLWANGVYYYTGLSSGKPSYLLEGTELGQFMGMAWNGHYWNMADDNEQRYSNDADTDWPPSYFWKTTFADSKLRISHNAMVATGGEWPTWGNGTYFYAGIRNGRPAYLLGDPDEQEHMYMSWTGAYWNMHDDDEQRYTNSADTLLPPVDGWLQMPSGQPSSLYVDNGAPVP